MNLCIVCEKPVIESNLKNTYYCNNTRCTRLGLLSVFVLVPTVPEKKDVQVVPKPAS